MTDYYVHGIETTTTEDGTDYVFLTTPVAITDEQVAQFSDDEELRENVSDEVILYKLLPVGKLRDGLPE